MINFLQILTAHILRTTPFHFLCQVNVIAIGCARSAEDFVPIRLSGAIYFVSVTLTEIAVMIIEANPALFFFFQMRFAALCPSAWK